MKNIINKFPHLIHGCDYNPEQWLNYPDILKKDIDLMKEAKINCVSLGIFSWSTLQPDEDIFNLDWLESIINNLYENGIYTILATPSGAMPQWLTKKYPEVMQMDSNRVRHLAGKRHNFCMSSPIFKEKIRTLNKKLSERFSNHKGVILWHISNEFGNNATDGSCHCPLCQEEFRKFLKEKYKTLDNLNHSWWSTFWSHTYTDWSQIESPSPQGETWLHGLTLDWKRFTSNQILKSYLHEVDSVKEYNPNLPVTTNMMDFFEPINYYSFAPYLDVVSWDSYPNWNQYEDNIDVAVSTSAMHNIFRSLKKQPFLLMESTPSIVNWKPINTQKRPNIHMLSSMQAIAHGSNSVQYFQWRKSRGSFEKFHGAVVGHKGTNDTREYLSVKSVGERLSNLPCEIYDTVNKPKVAIIFDWENWWAINDTMGPKENMDYVKTMLEHYKPFWNMGIDVDIIDMEQDLSAYKLVIAPMTYMLKEEFAKRVRTFVNKGNTYITTYWSGIVNETDLCFLGGFPGLISDILGICEEEIDATTDKITNSINYNNKQYLTNNLCDVIHTTTAKVLATYNHDYYKDFPAVTKNIYGKGTAYYIASKNEESFQNDFYQNIVNELGIKPNINTCLPYGVTVNKRCGEKDFYFLQNYNSTPTKVYLDDKYINVETNKSYEHEINLDGYSCVILTKSI